MLFHLFISKLRLLLLYALWKLYENINNYIIYQRRITTRELSII